MQICVIEDEQIAGEKIISLIQELVPESNIDWIRSIEEGLTYFKEQHPQIVFSDIELLDGNVFRLFDQIVPLCPIIFCTAYDDYYVDAFQTNGIAYLLKPYSKDQFTKAWTKYESLFSTKTPITENQSLKNTINTLLNKQSSNYKEHFTVKKRDGVYLININNISYFQADGDYVFIIDKQGKKHLITQSLSKIESLLNPTAFFRINRSEIIHFAVIQKYDTYVKSRLSITLSAPDIILYTSNSRSSEFKHWVADH